MINAVQGIVNYPRNMP